MAISPRPLRHWLITKSDFLSTATTLFQDTEVRNTTKGRPYLGSPIETEEFIRSYTSEKVNDGAQELELLATFGKTQPHAAYSALTHGLTSKWAYLSRTTPNIGPMLQPLETRIRSILTPTLTNRPPLNDYERELFALPARLGGIGLTVPTRRFQEENVASLKITSPVFEAILIHDQTDIMCKQDTCKKETRTQNRQKMEDQASTLKAFLPSSLNRAMALASEKGASSWLPILRNRLHPP